MNIVREDTVLFAVLAIGDVFQSKGGSVYMKIESPEGTNLDAVNLESGKTTNFADSTVVSKLNGSFYID